MTPPADPPLRIFDAHLHVIDPAHPLVGNDGFVPEPFTVGEYRARTAQLAVGRGEVEGGAVVSGSFQGFDQSYLVEALQLLGPSYVGVTQVPAETTDDQVRGLDAAGVRAVRFNLHRGGSAPLDDLERLARRVHDVAGWHTELYVDGRSLAELGDRVAALPCAVVDHLGLHRDGLPALLRLVERGVKVKATGFGRVDLDVTETLRAICAVDPTAPMFGTDLPSTRARRPFRDEDLDLLLETVGPDLAHAVTWQNAADLYLRRPRAS